MTIEIIKSDVKNILTSEGCSAEFYFLLRDINGMKVKLAVIDNKDHVELEDLFISKVNEKIANDENLSLLPLSGADERINTLYEYDLDSVPAEIINLKNILDNDDFERYDFNVDSLHSLEGILIIIGNQEKQLAVYKHHYPVTLLKNNSGFSLMKKFGTDKFKKLDQDILRVDNKFQFIRLNEKYYILDIKTLERFFGFHAAVKAVATKGIENITTSNLVMNTNVFIERLEDISFSRKLVKSAHNSPVLSVIPNEQIISFTNTHPALAGQFKYSSDGLKFDLKTKKSQNLFLKLLNDDFLQSELTKKYYDSVAKDGVDIAVVS